MFHPGCNPGANLKSISHRCHPILVAFVWELTQPSICPVGASRAGFNEVSSPVRSGSRCGARAGSAVGALGVARQALADPGQRGPALPSDDLEHGVLSGASPA